MYYHDIYDLITSEEANFKLPIPIMENYEWSMYDHIKTTVLYKNSIYKSGKDDNKPFKNILRPILNLQYRAEGFDVKDIVLYINDQYKYFKSFLVNKYHDIWARENHIDTFIDDMVESYVDFGGALIKDVREIAPEVVPWQRIVFCDQTDILSGPIAEKHYYSPDQLQEMSKKGWENIDEVILLSRKENDTKTVDSMTGRKAKTPGKYIEVYEVHGMLPKSWLKDSEGDESEEYVRQVHICTFYQDENKNKKGITLFSSKESELPYKLVLRDKIYGRALGLGGAEELFEPQVWTNYDIIHIKKMLDQASKIIYQTADPAFANRNKTTDLEDGEILVTEEGKPIVQINTTPVNLQVFNDSVERWEQHARQMGSAQEAIMGDQPPAGTPFKSVELQAFEGHSIHEYRKGKLATFLDEVYQDWIIPKIARVVSHEKEFIATLDFEELQQVADGLVKCETNKMVKEMILNGEVPTEEDILKHEDMVRKDFLSGGSKRFMKILEGEMKDAPMRIEINIAGKQKDMPAYTDKLVNVFRTIVANPAVLQNPAMAKIFNEILESSGLSPLDFYGLTSVPIQTLQQNPQMEMNQKSEMTPMV